MNTGKPVFKKTDLAYAREEKDEYLTIVPRLHPETRELIINKTARAVLELCNGERTIDQVMTDFASQHHDVSRKRLEADVNQALGVYSRLGIVEWIGENPFLNRREEPISDGYALCIAQEGDISRIEAFLRTNHDVRSNNGYFCHRSAIIAEGEYGKLALRQKLFSYSEEFFLLEKEQQIKGLISISIPYNLHEQSAIIKLLCCPVDYAKDLLTYAKDYYPRLSIRNITKIELCESVLHPLGKSLEDFLLGEGFVKEAKLKDELGFGEGMTIWSYIYPQDFIDEVNRQRKSMNQGKE